MHPSAFSLISRLSPPRVFKRGLPRSRLKLVPAVTHRLLLLPLCLPYLELLVCLHPPDKDNLPPVFRLNHLPTPRRNCLLVVGCQWWLRSLRCSLLSTRRRHLPARCSRPSTRHSHPSARRRRPLTRCSHPLDRCSHPLDRCSHQQSGAIATWWPSSHDSSRGCSSC